MTKTINIDEFSANTIKRVVEFMYTKDYDSDSEDRLTELFEEMLPFDPKSTKDMEVSTDYIYQDDLVTTDESVTDNILSHVRVNAAADYYDIPLLRKLANAKIRRIFKKSWFARGFPNVVKAVFDSTADVELRDFMAAVATSRIEELLELESFKALDVPSDFHLKVIHNMAAVHSAKEKQHSKRAADAEASLKRAAARHEDDHRTAAEMQTALQHEAARVNRIIESFESCAQALSDTSSCRNPRCDADFTCYIESGGTSIEPRFLLRCARCRCRHKSN
jgi:hypothetical protein